jgi:hypothetical protein
MVLRLCGVIFVLSAPLVLLLARKPAAAAAPPDAATAPVVD